MKIENDDLLKNMTACEREMEKRGEKINWFEKKLNKWVKLFEAAEQGGASRHNELIGKINEVDIISRREAKNLNERMNNFKGGKIDVV